MRFWDTSAIVPLITDESQSATAKSLLREDEAMAVWWATRVECISALTRRSPERTLVWYEVDQAQVVLIGLASSWSEVQPSTGLRDMAEALLRVHPLKAADACQLAAAMRWSTGAPNGKEFVSLDGALSEAATKEGFSVLPEQASP